MKLNWLTLKDRFPKRHDGFKPPYISCTVYSCNPKVKVGGVIERCRWDVKNSCWYKSDVRRNWYLQHPYEITHYADDIEPPIFIKQKKK